MGFLDKLLGKNNDNTLPVSVDDSNFHQEVILHKGPMILDVWGPGCAPCMKLVPVIKSLASEYSGKVKVCEMNAATAPRATSKLGVRGTPTIVVYRGGAEIGRVVGWKPKSYFDQMIESEFADALSASNRDPELTETAEYNSPMAMQNMDLSGMTNKAKKKMEKKLRQQASRQTSTSA